MLKGLAINETAATGPLASAQYVGGAIHLCADGSGQIDNIPEAVWSFAVSGYRVLPRWLAARAGLEIDGRFVPELRDVAGRIAELIDLFNEADSILGRTLNDPLSREALGFIEAPTAVQSHDADSENSDHD